MVDAACLAAPDGFVIVDDPSPDAFVLPGRPGRVVVSTGMLDILDPGERAILLAHERTHLAEHHYAFVALAQLGAAANPLLRPLAAAVAYTVERWADEQAAMVTDDRRRVARTVGKAALASRRGRTRACLEVRCVTVCRDL
jgi:Zn-dependent protease with chaperone function